MHCSWVHLWVPFMLCLLPTTLKLLFLYPKKQRVVLSTHPKGWGCCTDDKQLPQSSCHHGLGTKTPSTTLFVQCCCGMPGEEVSQELFGITSGRKGYVGAIIAWPYSQHHKARACHHVPLECPIILPRDHLKMRHDGASAASKHKFSALEKPWGQEANHPMRSGPALFGNWLRSGFGVLTFPKAGIPLAAPQRWSLAVGTPWVPPQRMS